MSELTLTDRISNTLKKIAVNGYYPNIHIYSFEEFKKIAINEIEEIKREFEYIDNYQDQIRRIDLLESNVDIKYSKYLLIDAYILKYLETNKLSETEKKEIIFLTAYNDDFIQFYQNYYIPLIGLLRKKINENFVGYTPNDKQVIQSQYNYKWKVENGKFYWDAMVNQLALTIHNSKDVIGISSVDSLIQHLRKIIDISQSEWRSIRTYLNQLAGKSGSIKPKNYADDALKEFIEFYKSCHSVTD